MSWQWCQVEERKASATILPRYWLSETFFPSANANVNSGDGLATGPCARATPPSTAAPRNPRVTSRRVMSRQLFLAEDDFPPGSFNKDSSISRTLASSLERKKLSLPVYCARITPPRSTKAIIGTKKLRMKESCK